MKTYIFDVIPVPKNRATQRDKWAPSPATLRYRAFADEMRLRAATENFMMPEDPALIFFMPMPKTWSEAKRNNNCGKAHTSRPDIDNLIKSWDWITVDDSYIHCVYAKKIWSCVPGIAITDINDYSNLKEFSKTGLCPKHRRWSRDEK